MELIAAPGGDDADLRAGPLAVLGAVGVFDHREFAYRIDSEELAADAARCVADFRGAGIFDAVEQEKILLRAMARNGEHVPEFRVGSASAAGALRGVVDGAGIEREELIVAAAVQGQIFDLPLSDRVRKCLRLWR